MPACSQIWPHHATYEVVALLIGRKCACVAKSNFYTTVADYNGPLEAVYYQLQSDRYDMELHVCFRSGHIGMNFTYDAVATLIRRKRARVVTNKLLYNHS